MAFAGGSQIAFRLSAAPPPISFTNDAQIHVHRIGTWRPVLVSTSSWNISSKAIHTGVVSGGLEFGNPTLLEGAYAHIFNFPDYVGDYVSDPGGGWRGARVVLLGGGWRVTVDAVPGIRHLIDRMNRGDGGHAITHLAKVEREDGSTFDRDPDLTSCRATSF